MMTSVKACRICLRTEIKMFKYDQFQLKCCYEDVMAIKVNEHDGLPQYFCYECSALLYKFHKFKEKCFSGQKALKAMLCKGPITYEAICKIDHSSLNLQSMLEVMVLNKRIQTYTFKRKSAKKLITKVHLIKNKRKNIGANKHKYEIVNDKKSNISTYLHREKISKDCVTDIGDEDINRDEKQIILDNEETPMNLTSVFIEQDDEKSVDIKQISCNSNVVFNNEDKIKVRADVGEIPNSLTTVYIKEDEQKMTLDEQAPTDLTTVMSDDDDNQLASDSEELLIQPITSIENDQEINLNVEKIAPNAKKPAKDIVLNKKKVKKQNYIGKFQRKRRELDMSHWEKYSLNEEEAMHEFQMRAQHRTYVGATYSCKDCLKGFSQEEMLNRHLKRRHHESIGKIECRFCHVRFHRMCKLRQHLEEHLIKYKCLRCNIFCKKKFAAIFHDESHSGVTQQCQLCGLEFRHSSTYYTHMRTHRSEHVCALCGASFVSALGLHNHKKIKHVIENENQKNPENQKEDKETSTFCEKCNIRFETQTAYDMHLLHSNLHVGDDPQLPVETSLKPSSSRRRKKHNITTKICYNQRYLCEICGASLAPGSVPMHENLHSREVLHTCDTCGRQFHTTVGLKRHLVTHTGEKPYPCPLCDKRFTQNNSMKLHYRTFHLKQPYPKRNRKKKTSEPEDTSLIADYYQNKEDLEDMPLDKWRALRS